MTSPKSPTAASLEPSEASTGGHWLGAIVAMLVSLALYLPTTQHDLVYDDIFLINPELNGSMVPVVTDISAAFDVFTQEYWANVNPERVESLKPRGQALYRPLTVFMWALTLNTYHDHDLTKPFDVTRGTAYHWINLIVNMLVVLGLHRLALRLFGNGRVAFLAAMIYALHPLHSEAVAYVAGLSDQLAALTVVTGALLFERATRGNGVRLLPTVALCLTLFIGLLAKESAVLVLAVCALTDVMWWLRGRAVAFSQRLAVYGSMFAALGAHIWIRYLAMGYLKPDTSVIGRLDNVLIDVPTTERVFNSFKLIAKYVWLVLWPKDLSVDYSFQAITVSPTWTSAGPLAGTILTVALVLVGLAKLKKSPAFGWGILVFTGCTIFTSNMLVPIGTVFAERLMYLPTLGAAVALAVVFDRLLGGAKAARPNPVGMLLLVLAMGMLGVRTWQRNDDFKNSLTLFRTAEAIVPRSARVKFQLGNIYAGQQLNDRAVQYFEQSLMLDSSFIYSAMRLGEVYLSDRNFEKADQTFTRILDNIQPQTAAPEAAEALRAMVLQRRADAKRGRGDMAAAQADLEAAMGLGQVDPVQATIQLARLLEGQLRFDEAIPIIRRGLQADEKNVELLWMLSRASARSNDVEAYEEALTRMEATELGRARALAMRAEVLYEQAAAEGDGQKRDQAMAMFDEVLSIDDTIVEAYFYRGRYMVERTRAVFDAIIQYDNALERAPEHGPTLLYKGLAQLQVNDPEGALETLKQLEAVNPGTGLYALMAEAYFKLGDLSGQEEMRRRLTELGKEPLLMALNRASTALRSGDAQKALEILQVEQLDPENADDPQLARNLGLVHLELGTCDEALANFENQGMFTTIRPDLESDLYLPVNTARALTCLGRHGEATAQLDLAEASLVTLDDQPMVQRNLQVSIVRRRAELMLSMGDPQRAADLAAEGIELTGRQHPGLYDLSIEALVALDDLGSALLRAQEATTLFFSLEHYTVVIQALETAQAGDRDAGAAALMGFVGQAIYVSGPKACQAIAARLKG